MSKLKGDYPIIKEYPRIESILTLWKSTIGENYEGYRGHIYRMFNFCLALHDCSEQDKEKMAIAACFHDMGLWSAQTVDYIPPSIYEAEKYLQEQGLDAWAEEVLAMIEWHHKVRAITMPAYPLVEVFRRGDLVDFSLGLIKFGLARDYVRAVKQAIPNQGFHRFLLKGAGEWFKKNPLTPPPFMRW